MAMVRKYGKPDLFVTFTWNPKSVSYTHLDVYKRQVHTFCHFTIIIIICYIKYWFLYVIEIKVLTYYIHVIMCLGKYLKFFKTFDCFKHESPQSSCLYSWYQLDQLSFSQKPDYLFKPNFVTTNLIRNTCSYSFNFYVFSIKIHKSYFKTLTMKY